MDNGAEASILPTSYVCNIFEVFGSDDRDVESTHLSLKKTTGMYLKEHFQTVDSLY